MMESPKSGGRTGYRLMTGEVNCAIAKKLNEEAFHRPTVFVDEPSGLEVKRDDDTLFVIHVTYDGVLRVVYHSRIIEEETPFGRGIYPSLVSRHPILTEGRGLKIDVMFGYMIGLHGILICDKAQDGDGGRLWLNVGAEALHRRGYKLFVWNDLTGYTNEVFSVGEVGWADLTDKGEPWGAEVVPPQHRRLIIKEKK